MRDSLNNLWSCFDSADPHFSGDELNAWDASMREWLTSARALRQGPAASMIVCPSCPDGHIEEVLAVPDVDPPRFFIPCPESLRVEIDARHIEQWTIDHDMLASIIAASLQLTGRVKAIVSGRLWRLGTTPLKGTRREVVLSRGLHHDDGPAIAAHLGQQGRQIVLVAQSEPPPHVWHGLTPACAALADLATLTEDGLELDVELLADVINRADDIQQRMSLLPIDAQSSKLAIRRQVKAEAKAQLEDDALIGAYRQFGSFREAAKALTEQLERPISKDKVRAAVQRAGGVNAVRLEEDSPSVKRRVVSQRRDRAKEIAQYQ